MIAFALLLYRDAVNNRSFYFALLAVLYGYIAISCLAARVVSEIDNDGSFILMSLYIPLSAAAFVYVLIKLNKKLKAL
jgi:hypothetical protein